MKSKMAEIKKWHYYKIYKKIVELHVIVYALNLPYMIPNWCSVVKLHIGDKKNGRKKSKMVDIKYNMAQLPK